MQLGSETHLPATFLESLPVSCLPCIPELPGCLALCAVEALITTPTDAVASHKKQAEDSFTSRLDYRWLEYGQAGWTEVGVLTSPVSLIWDTISTLDSKEWDGQGIQENQMD